ncbi:hypothetical protein GCM10017767_20550 [Halomonas urumqiensis]|nr:hypothetical protein GCM10017767_20550 [Halomonas urumqiensis]
MNDPNGLVFFDDEYHLFYQYYPHDRVWGPMHWGHAVSRDLVTWETLPTALSPDEAGMCFSGSAIVDEHDESGLFAGERGLAAFYTVHRPLSDDPQDYRQAQCLAVSDDRGRSWRRYTGNPLIESPGIKDFRDPKVFWHAPSRRWVMALACGQVIHFYVSENLLDWRLVSEFGEGQGAHTGHPWECPDLFELPVEGAGSGEPDSRWVLVVGIGASDDNAFGSFTQYFIGHFDGVRFHNENPADRLLMMDEGRDFYAVQSWSGIPERDGRRLVIAWMSNWQYANQTPESGWRGAMSFPRELSLIATAEGVRLRQRFAGELTRLPWRHCSGIEPLVLTAGRHVLANPASGQVQGRLTLAMAPQGRVEIDIQQGGHQRLVVTRQADGLRLSHWRRGENGQVAFDSHYPHAHDVGHLPGTRVTLEWLLDEGSLELLIDDGRISLTHLSFAEPARLPLAIEVLAGTCRVEALALCSLEDH